MALTRVGTHPSRQADKAAVVLVVDGREISLSHAQVAERSEEQIESALQAAASTSDVALPRIFLHWNRDGDGYTNLEGYLNGLEEM